MKVWEKIAQEFEDAKEFDKDQIADICYELKYCPSEIEENHNFIGLERHGKHCDSHECDYECLVHYLELEAN